MNRTTEFPQGVTYGSDWVCGRVPPGCESWNLGVPGTPIHYQATASVPKEWSRLKHEVGEMMGVQTESGPWIRAFGRTLDGAKDNLRSLAWKFADAYAQWESL